MARMRLLDLAKPFSAVVPEVEIPYQKVEQLERLAFTVGAAILYTLLVELPLYGVKNALETPDPIPWLRPGLGMAHGTPAELGVVPIVLSGMFFQILAGLRKLNVNLDFRSDRALFQNVQKLVALGIAAVLGLILAFSPAAYAGDLAPTRQLFVAFQILGGSTVIVYMDEVISRGYGIGSGVLLFTSVRAAQQFAWAVLSFQSVQTSGRFGWQTWGALPNLVFGFTGRSLPYAVSNAVFRADGLPTLFDLIVAVSVFLGVIYLSSLRQNLQIRSTRMRAQVSAFPIRVLYTGVQPILLVLSSIAAYMLASFGLSSFIPSTNIVARIFGVWDGATAVSGLASLLVPTIGDNLLTGGARLVIYVSLFTLASAWVGSAWAASSGFAPQDIAKQFKNNSIVLVGKRDVSVVKELRRVIPPAAALGGALLGFTVAATDFLGPGGWGSTMSIAALNLLNAFELLAQEGMVGPDASIPGLM